MDSEHLSKMQKRLDNVLMRRSAAKQLSRDASSEAVDVLRDAVSKSGYKTALNAVISLAGDGNTDAREALCKLVLDDDNPIAREVALKAGYAPRDASQRALFFFLTEQWERYESLDFDQSMLRAIYDTADDNLRRRISSRARQAGRIDWVSTATGGHGGRRLGEMTDEEWETAISVLESRKSWKELWRLAQMGTPVWSKRMLSILGRSDWQPEREDERDGYERLLNLAVSADEDIPVLLASQVRCMSRMEEITYFARTLATSPDGRILASGGWDKTIRLWRLPDGEHIRTLKGHTKWVNALTTSPDGRILASGSEDSTICLWSLPHGEHIRTLEGHTGSVWTLTTSPDGRILASGSWDSTICLWSLPHGEHIRTLWESPNKVLTLITSPDGRILASGSDDSTIHLWSLPDGEHVRTLLGHTDGVLTLTTSPDGRILASGSGDNTIRLWSLPDGEHIRTLEGHTKWVNALTTSPDGRILASGSRDHTIRLWSLPDGEHIRTLEGYTNSTFTPPRGLDLMMLASGSWDDTIRLWSLPDGEHIRYGVWTLTTSPDGRILASGYDGDTILLWDISPLRIAYIPIVHSCLGYMDMVNEALGDSFIRTSERNWLEFIHELMRWWRRSDIIVEESSIDVGEFDIEIER